MPNRIRSFKNDNRLQVRQEASRAKYDYLGPSQPDCFVTVFGRAFTGPTATAGLRLQILPAFMQRFARLGNRSED